MPIQYGGRRTRWHLDVGHILDRESDHRLTWAIEDTRPEHATCNRAAGADVTNAKRRRRSAPIVHSQRW